MAALELAPDAKRVLIAAGEAPPSAPGLDARGPLVHPCRRPRPVIGNTAFGDPNELSTWWFGIPSIWAWQVLGWASGVGLICGSRAGTWGWPRCPATRAQLPKIAGVA